MEELTKRNVELIENKEIRGLSYRTFTAILISTTTIVISIASFYFLLKADISTINLNKAKDDKYNDLRMQIMETSVKELQTRVDRITFQVQENTESRMKK